MALTTPVMWTLASSRQNVFYLQSGFFCNRLSAQAKTAAFTRAECRQLRGCRFVSGAARITCDSCPGAASIKRSGSCVHRNRICIHAVEGRTRADLSGKNRGFLRRFRTSDWVHPEVRLNWPQNSGCPRMTGILRFPASWCQTPPYDRAARAVPPVYAGTNWQCARDM